MAHRPVLRERADHAAHGGDLHRRVEARQHAEHVRARHGHRGGTEIEERMAERVDTRAADVLLRFLWRPFRSRRGPRLTPMGSPGLRGRRSSGARRWAGLDEGAIVGGQRAPQVTVDRRIRTRRRHRHADRPEAGDQAVQSRFIASVNGTRARSERQCGPNRRFAGGRRTRRRQSGSRQRERGSGRPARSARSPSHRSFRRSE